MRFLSAGEQEDRKRKLLQAIIHLYIKSGKPVGSVSITQEYKLDLSSATIRHIMVELENEGYLTHPHTSAGRVPTDKAYRFYVDSLAELQRLAQLEEERIHGEYKARIREIEDLMLSTSKTLSKLSHYTGFVLAPGLEEARLQHLQLIPLDSHRLLVILVSDSGMVKNRIVMFENPIPLEFLTELSQILNSTFKGKVFSDVRDSLEDSIERLLQERMRMVDFARHIAQQAFEVEEGDLYLEGTSNILSLPDFQDQEEIRALIHLLDEKKALGELLSQDLVLQKKQSKGDSKKVRVVIGEENKSPNLKNLSLISSSYSINGKTVGVLGIIGPKRMEYSHMMSLVGHISEVVTKFLNKLSGG